jgi:hypothetical protein
MTAERTDEPMDEPSSGACKLDQARTDVDPVDIQRLLSWYFDVQHPGRPHITSRGHRDPILG